MFEEKINRETAIKDVNSWLDAKKIRPSLRAYYVGNIDNMVDYVMTGNLVINADATITQKLNFPIGSTSEFTYKVRLGVAEINESLANSPAGPLGQTIAYGAALSNENSGVIGKMDSTDASILAALAVFFTQ